MRWLIGAILVFGCSSPSLASFKTRDDEKAHALAQQASKITGENPQGRCYLYVLKALLAAKLLPHDYWKYLATNSAYKFGFGRRRADLPHQFPLKMVLKYAPWKEGTIVVWNRDPDSIHSCGRDTKMGKIHGHIEVVVDPETMGRPERSGSYMSCFGICGYTSIAKVNSYLRKGCIRVYEPARLSS